MGEGDGEGDGVGVGVGAGGVIVTVEERKAVTILPHGDCEKLNLVMFTVKLTCTTYTLVL